MARTVAHSLSTKPAVLGCHPSICPYGTVFTTADQRQLVLAVGATSDNLPPPPPPPPHTFFLSAQRVHTLAAIADVTCQATQGLLVAYDARPSGLRALHTGRSDAALAGEGTLGRVPTCIATLGL